MNIILATKSPIKIQAVEEVLQELLSKGRMKECNLSVEEVNSNVPDTPYDHETYQGAHNRVKALRSMHSDVDLYVGLESGLLEREGKLFEECWCVILTKNGEEFAGYSSGMMLSRDVLVSLRKGKDHITTLREIAPLHGLNHKDTWSVYSKGHLLRKESIKESFRNALLAAIA